MNTKIIKNKINQKQLRPDRNGRDYLLLKLATSDEAIFVFPSKVKKERWEQLKEGEEYEFIVEESNNGSNLLVDFDTEETIFI